MDGSGGLKTWRTNIDDFCRRTYRRKKRDQELKRSYFVYCTNKKKKKKSEEVNWATPTNEVYS